MELESDEEDKNNEDAGININNIFFPLQSPKIFTFRIKSSD